MTLVSIQKGVIPVPRHWDPENLIVYYTTFSIKSWIPDWNDITGALEFLFQYLYINHASEQTMAST
ncbi:WPE palindromic element domain-containing protein [Wolbachia endosymbiont of Dactylopius coccus]